MINKIKQINHKNFLKEGGRDIMSNLINEDIYSNALNIAKENETKNEVSNLLVSINGISELFDIKEMDSIEENKTPKSTPIEVCDLNNDEELKWIEGALNIQNKNAFEKSEYEKILNANSTLTKELNGLYVEKETLEKAREDALKNFDIVEVVKIDERLKNIKQSYQYKLSEVDNIKNNIKSREDDYKFKLSELEDKLKDVNFNNAEININREYFGNSVLNDYKNNKVLNMVKSFLSNYSKADGKTILQNTPELISALGDNYKVLLGELN